MDVIVMGSCGELSVDNRIQQLDIAEGLKELLIKAGITAETICRYSCQEVSEILHIDPYVSRIILDEAHKVIDGKATMEEIQPK